MSKAIEKKIESYDKRLVWYFNLYRKLMWTDKNNDKNKINLNPSSFDSFLIGEKLPGLLSLWNFQISVCFYQRFAKN